MTDTAPLQDAAELTRHIETRYHARHREQLPMLAAMAERVEGHGMVPRDDLAAVAVAALDAPQTEGLALDLIGGGSPVAEALASLG